MTSEEAIRIFEEMVYARARAIGNDKTTLAMEECLRLAKMGLGVDKYLSSFATVEEIGLGEPVTYEDKLAEIQEAKTWIPKKMKDDFVKDINDHIRNAAMKRSKTNECRNQPDV